MRSKLFKSVLVHSGLAISGLLMAGTAGAQQQINLTAAPAIATMPDGNAVPMWGYSCGALVSGSSASCAALKAGAAGSNWSPVVITVPSGQDLQINLTNSLIFGANSVPTSLVIVGQLGGGLGLTATSTASPDHTNAQPVTWPIASTQPNRPGTWANAKAYATNQTILDPNGNVQLVTTAGTSQPSGTPAWNSTAGGVTADGTVQWTNQGTLASYYAAAQPPAGAPPQQGNRVQSFSTEVAPGATTSLTWAALRPGTYLIESGTHPSIQGPMGLYGILVVTTAPIGATPGTAYPGVLYNAEVPLLLSEIDPVQNSSVNQAVHTAGFSETMVWSGQPGGCGNPSSPTFNQCYPPAVNYTPMYFMINGTAFDKTHAGASLFPTAPAMGVVGNVLVRLVNAGLRMHVPSIVGSLTGAGAQPGLSLIAEDGNVLPGNPRVQSEVFMAAGKTFDVMLNTPLPGTTALPIFDRELSLSGNSTARDNGMLAYIGVNGATVPAAAGLGAAVANPDTYNAVIAGQTLTVSDPSKGLLANDVGVYGVQVQGTAPAGLILNTDGTFSYSGPPTTFTYCGNGTTTVCALVTLGAATVESGSDIVMNNTSYSSTVATILSIASPGPLSVDKDNAGYALSAVPSSVVASPGLSVLMDSTGGFKASVTSPGTYTFTYKAMNSQGTTSASSATVTLNFPSGSGPSMVTVLDGKDVLANKLNPSVVVTHITDYRWIIEEDRTFYINPNCTTNPPPAGCPSLNGGIVPTFGTNFHTSYMPIVAAGCTGPLSCESGQTVYDPVSGAHVNAVCDVGNGSCRADPSGNGQAPLMPSAAHLDPSKHYYLTILPGDAGTPFHTGNLSADCTNGQAAATNPGKCGHGMGGTPLAATCTSPGVCSFGPVTVLTQPDPFPPSKLSVYVFEDDFSLNGEHDGGAGIGVVSPLEPGLGGFNITLFDDAGGPGDATGQMTYDMFNQPLSNSLAGTIDPATGKDACPISVISRIGPQLDANGKPIPGSYDQTQSGITGTIVTCPKYESDGVTLSPIAGQAVVANLMPGRYGVVATPGADRIGKGEEWLQTNTLDGQKAHDSFLRVGEPSFFQEYGPAGYHVSIGFASPGIINSRTAGICGGKDPFVTGADCVNTLTGRVTTERMSRSPDERLYSSGDNSSFAFTQCYVSVGDADSEDFAFTKCDANGNFTLTGLPDGDWRITVFDQWNDMLVDGLSTPVRLGSTTGVCPGAGSTQHSCNMGDIAMNQWQTNIYTSTFFDANGNGVRDSNESGLTLVPTNIRFRDGSYSNFNNTDLSGNAGFNEVFPLFNWYVIETDSTRYKNTGTHVVYDAGGPADGTPCGTAVSPPTAPCGNSTIAANKANTFETISVPAALRVPGAVYCDNADCNGFSIANGPASSAAPSNCTISPTTGVTSCTGPTLSTGRIDPPWVTSEGWQGFSGQNSFLEFGKAPYATGENGGIRGEVIYASTRPFDDPTLLIHTSWTPDVPNVTINLYQEGTNPANGSQILTLVDTTKTSSWDDWAQGFYSNGKPHMNCPGQLPAPTSSASGDLFYFTLFNQPMFLDVYNNGGTVAHQVPNNSQFKCYDGMHNWNELQPAPYDGMYQFPSIAGRDPTSGAPVGGSGSVVGTNCKICTTVSGNPMLPPGKYVVEMVVPPGYELVKEEDKNILIGDNFIAPVTVEFPGLGGSIYILPDQAQVSALYNANNFQNPTNNLGRTTLPSHEGDTGSVETFWPCVGAARVVPDYISLFPQSHEVAPFAGATRHLCDRKEVQLDDQTSALAKFWVFTSAHVAAHFTGVITDDFTSEFDPFSPQFGEKFSPANLPIAIKDWTGSEISRVYSDQWGAYNGLTYSTWEVNPPNPTGYAPTMMVTCMNDPGSGPTPDPLYNPAYSQFCYEIPFMPGQTQYMDTPVVPTSAFAGAAYNNPDCAYPDATPSVSEVDGDGIGPWVSSATNHTLKIFALSNANVNNYGYSGPAAKTAPFNQKTVARHYGFGSAPGTVTLVGADGVPHPLGTVTWNDREIVGTVPTGLPNCPVQQQLQYTGTPVTSAQCGQLLITTAAGKQSIDSVTVTIGGKQPHHVLATDSVQAAIDNASPGDMLMIDPATQAVDTGSAVTFAPAVHQEMLLMWKPVRLQGVGAVASIVNANTHPAGKLDDWRRQVNCLFGLALNGQPISTANAYDPTGTYICPYTTTNATVKTAKFGANTTTLRYFNPNFSSPQIDRLAGEPVVGWDATQNGDLAELLQEPTLMGALEGAGITVLSRGVVFPAGSSPFLFTADPTETGFPTGTQLLNGTTNASRGCGPNFANSANKFPGNFYCNPSSIDALTVTNSSQGGGGIFVHGWGHNIQIANNRVTNNSGTLSGGINVGQSDAAFNYTAGGTNVDPGSCQSSTGLLAGTQLQYCFDVNVNLHHNAITSNSSTGDELFSATPAGAGGATICNGSDYYKFNYNWVCGNLSTGDGGGVAQMGFMYNGDIEHNSILFNQSTNPTIQANGGGLLVMGTADQDPPCANVTDQDCVSVPPSLPSDGAGPGLVINANLIMGNAAESGSGGGLRLQNINGTDVLTFPMTPTDSTGTVDHWYKVTITNNIIANNVAGWDGAGISLQDALYVNIVNNTIISNDTTASSGVLFNTLGAPLASSGGPTCTSNCGTNSLPQPAGVVAIQNSTELTANLPANIMCPLGHGANGTGTGGRTNGACRKVSFPELYNDVIWQNRAYQIGVGSLGIGAINQQNVVALYNASFAGGGSHGSVPGNQTATGSCPAGSSYWDIGVRSDAGPADHGSGFTLTPTYSVLTSTVGYTATGLNNTAASPAPVRQYCDGARVPPENGGLGYNVPPGIADATVPNPIFSLTPAATVDEGNNWINISWGPLSLVNPVTLATLGDYSPAPGSSVINYIGSGAATYASAPTLDFFGTNRKTDGAVDAGAVEFTGGSGTAIASVTGGPLAFGNVGTGTTSAAQTLTLHNTGTGNLTGISVVFSSTTYSRPAGAAGGTCSTTLTPMAGTCTINVVFSPTAAGPDNQTATITANVGVAGSPVSLSGTGVSGAAVASVTGGPLAFGNVGTGTTSAPQTLTLHNTGTANLTGITLNFSSSAYSRPAGAAGGTCTGTLTPAAASCTINVVFTPSAPTTVNATLTITANATVTGSPVNMSGTGVSGAAATLTPTSWTTSATRGCTASVCPTQTFTLTNTGSTTLTGIGAGVLGGTNAGEFLITSSSCGSTVTSLPTNGTCTVNVRFRPLSGQTTGVKHATVSVTDSAGTQTSTMTGTAN